MSASPKVYIVDDNPDHLNLMAQYLAGTGYQIETYASGVEFIQSGFQSAPGCILLDNMMPDMTGIQVQNEILALNSQLPIIFMSGHSSYEEVFTATLNGAVAFLQKPVSKERLCATVQRAVTLSTEMRESMVSTMNARMLFDSLTEREKEVFHLLIAGKHNKMIANKLDISLRTVEFHRANVLEKLHANFLSDLISIAKNLGL